MRPFQTWQMSLAFGNTTSDFFSQKGYHHSAGIKSPGMLFFEMAKWQKGSHGEFRLRCKLNMHNSFVYFDPSPPMSNATKINMDKVSVPGWESVPKNLCGHSPLSLCGLFLNPSAVSVLVSNSIVYPANPFFTFLFSVQTCFSAHPLVYLPLSHYFPSHDSKSSCLINYNGLFSTLFVCFVTLDLNCYPALD